jgi:TonB family protein
METLNRFLLTFLLNSIWQIPLAAMVAALACRFLRDAPAAYRHAVWTAALAISLFLPLAGGRRQPPPGPSFNNTWIMGDAAAAQAPTTVRASAQPAGSSNTAPVSIPRTVSLGEKAAGFLIGFYILFVLFRLARLGLDGMRLARLRRASYIAPLPALLREVWDRCQAAFGLPPAELRFSRELKGPVAAGGAIILPESLLTEESEDVLTTAIGHEMAHVARRDFASNVLFEVLGIPIAFHPVAWLIRRRIESAREMACDDLVTTRLIAPGAYARSIMSIAAGMTGAARPACALGVLDGGQLEERIRRLMEHPARNLKRARLALGAGLAALALCALGASSLSVSAWAQGPAGDAVKQAVAAYNRGDFQAAIDQFEAAVRLEPANVKPKLFLAHALLRQSTNPDDPATARARQQYLDVLAIEPANKTALEGITLVLVNSHQLAEAHDYALKAIQANPQDKYGYYTAGFIDWAIAYPDYAAARAAAGMKPPDPGVIPDASIREGFREKHGARIEEGFRMLQIALQIDPGYSDAMAYMNLLDRIQAAIANSAEESARLTAQANDWVAQALAAKRKAASNPVASAAKPLDVDGPAPGPLAANAPPPPPPPPPPGQPSKYDGETLYVAPRVQQAKLVDANQPAYPEAARNAGISGEVVLNIVIAKDGSVAKIVEMRGHPMLAPAALDAVRQWKYQPTLLNNQPIQVATQVTVNFTLGNQ